MLPHEAEVQYAKHSGLITPNLVDEKKRGEKGRNRATRLWYDLVQAVWRQGWLHRDNQNCESAVVLQRPFVAAFRYIGAVCAP